MKVAVFDAANWQSMAREADQCVRSVWFVCMCASFFPCECDRFDSLHHSVVGIRSIFSLPHYDQNLHEGKVEAQLAVGLLRDGWLLIVANVLPRRGGHPHPLSTHTFPLSWLVSPPPPLVKTLCDVPARVHPQNSRFQIRLQNALPTTASPHPLLSTLSLSAPRMSHLLCVSIG
jgi:hypothetical protein